ncbi:MAG: methyltransferase domain-containing protein [Phycisphaerales bacterium]|nr:MAG: methyltransferase domain-containing protein [Phycisphaerales bacterium]
MSTPDHAADGAMERLDPTGRLDHLAAQHVARYAFAAQRVAGQRVLDIACGPGYGSAMLADAGATRVLGIDRSQDAIADAQVKHARVNVEFRAHDVFTLTPSDVGEIDTIVCLETLEHVEDPERVLDVFRTLLPAGGLLVLSVPNDAALHADNPHHRWRADFATVRAWLLARFAHVACGIEAHAAGSLVLAVEDDRVPQGSIAASVRTMGELSAADAPGFVFVCSDDPARGVLRPGGAMLADGLGYVRSMQSRLDSTWRETQRLAEQAAGDASEIAALQAQLADLHQRYDALWVQLEDANTDRADAHERARRYAAERETAQRELDTLARAYEAVIDERDRLRAILQDAGGRRAQRWLARLGVVSDLRPPENP